MKNKCSECRYFVETRKERNVPVDGACHRYPPTLAGDLIEHEQDREVSKFTLYNFPTVCFEDYCGEFKPRK